ALVEALSEKNEYTRERVVDALAIHGRKSHIAVTALLKTLKKDESPRVRGSAALALGKIGALNDSAVPALARALSDSDEQVGQAAASALEEIGPAAKAAVSDLIKAVKSRVHDAAGGALKKIDPEAGKGAGVK